MTDFHKEQREQGWYGIARWCKEDVHLYREGMEWATWTDEQADKWLASIEISLRDRMTETGWEVIETLMEKE